MAPGCGGNPAPFAYLGREFRMPAGTCLKVPEPGRCSRVPVPGLTVA